MAAVRRDDVLLDLEERALGELGHRPDDERRRLAGRGEERGGDVAGHDERDVLHHALEEPRRPVRGPHLARDVEDRLEGGEAALGLAEQPRALAAQGDVLEGPGHRLAEVRDLPGLHDVAVDLAAVDGVDDVAGVGVGGEQDGAQVVLEPPGPLDQLDARHPGHALVGDEEVDGARGEDGERLLAVRRAQDLVAVHGRERTAQQPEDLGLVVHEEDDVRHRCARSPAPEARRRTC